MVFDLVEDSACPTDACILSFTTSLGKEQRYMCTTLVSATSVTPSEGTGVVSKLLRRIAAKHHSMVSVYQCHWCVWVQWATERISIPYRQLPMT